MELEVEAARRAIRRLSIRLPDLDAQGHGDQADRWRDSIAVLEAAIDGKDDTETVDVPLERADLGL